jgi:hypothetical protein
MIVALCMVPLLLVVMVIEGRMSTRVGSETFVVRHIFSSFLVMLAWGSMSLHNV